ncbi:MAG: arsenate reductase (glutaredoxin) [Marivivens sp.]|jgi:arsenate reductase|uniref:arsenate reductase (glutaredoxin) n=1 Tax=Marivivens sp. TaxID=1978374 RepID=UPI00201F11E4|nr:arsenate reductase (glutaredoxin) [Marivivens sp.]MCL7405418.1 arsenate reductase (glutaredoxin) [Marivivens geojensis]NBX09431.1 arsenate reductase (glutaredoxin) [Marivivens sp.]
MITIWHNPRCSKSRETLALLADKGITPEVRLYLDDVPTADELRSALAILGLAAGELVRRKEALFKDLDLANAHDDQLIDAMAANPKLIERPIVFANGRAALGRPPENVLAIL